MEVEEVKRERKVLNLINRVPQSISSVVENFFYRLGINIAKNPVKWMVACTIVVLLCLLGLFRFRQEKNPLKLWIPPESDFVRDTEWLMTNFKEGQQTESMILTGDDILEPEALLELNAITKRILALQTPIQPKIAWTDVCFKLPVVSSFVGRQRRGVNNDDFFDEVPGDRMNRSNFEPSVHAPAEDYCEIVMSLPKGCLVMSILDLWDYNSDWIRNQTKDDIVAKLNSAKLSPSLGHPMDFASLLGGVKTDENGRIISATAVQTLWVVHINFTSVNMEDSGNNAGTAHWATMEVLNWEKEYLRELESISASLNARNEAGMNIRTLKIWYEAGRSWGDISSSTMFQDIDKVFIGVLLMSIYVQLLLSRFNWVEWRFCLTMIGLLCVGGAFIVAIGLCSLCGVPYGPVHTSLPFMLMGLGVDDIFVMMASWEQVLSYEPNRLRPLPERVGLMLSHAGAAIFVTSFTDVVAFIIGASTILPSLQSFCIYAAVGVMMNFILQVTFFVAYFSIDIKRIENKRNGVVPCIVHENYESTFIDPSSSISWRFIDFIYSKIILTTPGKVTVLLTTIAIASVGVIGSYQLKQWFDPQWFLPEDSYLAEFMAVKTEHYPGRGQPGNIFIGNIKYHEEFTRILSLTESLRNMTTIEHLDSWPRNFADFVGMHYEKDLTKSPIDQKDFYNYLSKFLYSRSGGKYQGNFIFESNLTCGKHAPRIQISRIDFSFATFNGPDQWIPAMDNAKRVVNNAGIHGFATVWSRAFGPWVTDKVIAEEVTRNLILALICVMATTALLIAELQTCFWILLCVLLTLLDVCGFMFYWGLSIDITSCIGLELAVGLSVDYAAHVAHAFLNTASPDGNRSTRTLIAVRHIGAAVTYGAGSTLLAQSLMIFSEAYVFRTFFKIFLLVIVFGIWHGLVLLPVVLSTIGPRSIHAPRSRVKIEESSPKDCEEVEMPLNEKTADQ